MVKRGHGMYSHNSQKIKKKAMPAIPHDGLRYQGQARPGALRFPLPSAPFDESISKGLRNGNHGPTVGETCNGIFSANGVNGAGANGVNGAGANGVNGAGANGVNGAANGVNGGIDQRHIHGMGRKRFTGRAGPFPGPRGLEKAARNGAGKPVIPTRAANVALQRTLHANRLLPGIVCQDDQYRMWLRHYQPFCHQELDERGNRIFSKALNECAQHAELRIMPKDSVLFNPGERDYVAYYLLVGQVRIKENVAGKVIFHIINSSAPGQYSAPVGGDCVPRTVHAQVVCRSAFLGLDMESPQLLGTLNNLITTADRGNAQHLEGHNWVETLLGQRWLKLVEGESAHQLFSYTERVEVSAGEVLQEFNRPVQHVYIIEKGSCLLFEGKPMSLLMAMGMVVNGSDPHANGQPVRTLCAGSIFGDVYAVNPHDKDHFRPSPFTVQMKTAGIVHRIARADFNAHFGHYVFDWMIGHMDDRS